MNNIRKKTPDEARYLRLGRGEKVYKPFNRRILFPMICGGNENKWKYLNYISIALLPILVGLYVYDNLGSLYGALFAIGLMATTPSFFVWRTFYCLVDVPSFCLAILGALLPFPYNLIIVSIGGFGREIVPIFASLYALNPILLFGLIPVGIYGLFAPEGRDFNGQEEILDKPWRAAKQEKAGKWRDPDIMLYPWGGMLAGLFFPSFHLILSLLISYMQIFIATDTVRLYIWAAPVMCLHAAKVDPMYMLPILFISLFNAKRGYGL